MTPARSSQTKHGARIGGFFNWWGHELAGVLTGVRPRVAQRQIPRLVVSIERDGFQLIDGRTPRARSMLPIIEQFQNVVELLASLEKKARSGAQTAIGVRLPWSACFVRNVELPTVDETHVASLLALDLERNSPFLLSDIRTAHLPDPSRANPGKLALRQLIVKRADSEPLIARINDLGLAVISLDCWNEDGSAALPVNFLATDAEPPHATTRAKAMLAILAGAAVILTVSAALLLIDRHQQALSDIQTRTAQLTAKAQASRNALAKSKAQFADLSALQRLRDDYVSKAYALNELTKLLPDQVWLTDLKIEGTSIDITGFAASTSNVVRILERSSTFGDVSMTNAVTFDQREDRERFSLRMKLRTAQVVATPSPPETKP